MQKERRRERLDPSWRSDWFVDSLLMPAKDTSSLYVFQAGRLDLVFLQWDLQVISFNYSVRRDTSSEAAVHGWFTALAVKLIW